MKDKRLIRKKAIEAKEKKQANRVINGIFTSLIVLVVLVMIAYYLLS